MRSKDLSHLSCPSLLFPLLLFPPAHWFPFPSLSHALTPFSLLLRKLAQLSVSPPAVPPAACPPERETPQQYRSQVKRKNRLRSQWTSGAQYNNRSLFLLQPFPHCCQNWKRQTFGEVAEDWGGSSWTAASQASSPLHSCLNDHSDKHTHMHRLLFSPLHLCTQPPYSLFMSRAIMCFNTVIKVKSETFVISWVI